MDLSDNILVTLNSCRGQLFSVTAYTAAKKYKRQLNLLASIISLIAKELSSQFFKSPKHKSVNHHLHFVPFLILDPF